MSNCLLTTKNEINILVLISLWTCTTSFLTHIAQSESAGPQGRQDIIQSIQIFSQKSQISLVFHKHLKLMMLLIFANTTDIVSHLNLYFSDYYEVWASFSTLIDFSVFPFISYILISCSFLYWVHVFYFLKYHKMSVNVINFMHCKSYSSLSPACEL